MVTSFILSNGSAISVLCQMTAFYSKIKEKVV